ncbi:MAG TPA: glycoside hydrolase family 2 TIM barrel-domain containing protein [Sphingobacterium sp.]|jgi:beta-galactosidase|nr:glycoside hydrolase family 2 TIM barrel-domain containing protein [Sphingobacterium sp.]
MFSKFVSFLVLFVAVLPGMTQPREAIDFNGDWFFTLEDDLQFRRADFSPTNWKKVSLPHDWSIGFDFGEEYPAGNAGGALPGGVGWYRKTFQLPEKDKGSHYILYFGGVYRYAEVWINGKYLGKNINGYLSFEHDLTPHLRYGKEQNVIAVRVDNSLQPNSRWYTGSGIYRDVRLEKRSSVHLLREETFITTPEVSTEKSVLRVQSAFNQNTAGQVRKVALKLQDKNKKTVAEKTITLSDNRFEDELEVSDIALWTPDNPTLYDLHITVLDHTNNVLDVLQYQVGFRFFHFDEQKGFSLNGEPFKLLGVCLHHDLGALGAAFNKSAAKRQLLMMKDMGVNAIRTAHNPPAEEFLDLCDELGFLVQNEAYDMWAKRKNKFDYHLDFKEHYIDDLISLVKRDRNHPSVFMWSIGNEIREQFDSTGIAFTKKMTEVVKKLDPTRPVTAALTETNYDKNFIAQAGVLDVLGFNYKYFDYDKLPTEFKGVPLIASETTSALQTRGVYDSVQDTLQLWPASSQDKFVTNGNPDFTVSAYDNVAAYWGTSHERAWIEVKKRDFLGGIFVWTGFDYLGEPVPYPYPARSSYYGIVDLAGLPKDVYYMYQSEWTDTDVLHLLPHWNWKEGEQVDVWCYYNNADEVELFLNGHSLGRRSKTEDKLHAEWKVPFEAGELKVTKIKDGAVVQEVVKKTAGKPVDIVVNVEHDRYAVDGKTDLHFLTVSLVDENGTVVPDNDVELSFIPQDNITIVGTDNGYQADLHSLSSAKRDTYKGLAVAIAQKHNSEKEAKIIIKSNTIEKEIRIK